MMINIPGKTRAFILLLLVIVPGLQTLAQNKYQQQLLHLQQSIKQQFYDSATGYYREHAEQERNKNPASYLWPLCGMIQADNEIERLNQGQNLMPATINVIKRYYDNRLPAPGYASYPPALGGGDRFYDDNQWIGIALMDAYFRTPHPEYLKLSQSIYRFMMTAYDTAAGGGLYWQEGKLNSKNTCSNGPGIILALQLYKASKKKAYLDTAILLYNWATKNLEDSEGLYYDNIAVPGRKIDPKRYSYNTGTMLQSNIYLYELTGNKKYLQKAIRIAESSVRYFYGSGKLMDGYWFNAVMLRAYQHLLVHSKEPKYIRAFSRCIDNAIENQMLPNGLMGTRNNTSDLVNQEGMLEILARLTYLFSNYQF
jgi:uncharacterized protein YyaL (SSP411 family)